MIPIVDITQVADDLRRYATELVRTFEDEPADEADPRGAIEALGDCLDEMRRIEHDTNDYPDPPRRGEEGPDIEAIGNHALGLVSRLAALAGELQRPREARGIEELALPLACWIARNGAELSVIDPVVNAAAALANRCKEPSDLERLYSLLSEVVAAVSPQLTQEATGARDATRPWRVLLLNRAIVATRSHRPAHMEEAFEALVEQMPDDAPRFFREGMEQMAALNYPHQVRVVMQRYYVQWCAPRMRLH